MEPKHAQEDLHYIRQIMSQVSPPLSMSGWMGVGWGVVFFVGGGVSHIFQVITNGALSSSFLFYFWIPLLVIGSVTETFFYVRKCLYTGMPIFNRNTNCVYLGSLSSIIAGIAIHLILSKLGGYLYIPGAWMLIIGSCCIISGLFASIELCILGLLYMVGGLLAVGPYENSSFLVLAFFGGICTFVWGVWVNHRLGG